MRHINHKVLACLLALGLVCSQQPMAFGDPTPAPTIPPATTPPPNNNSDALNTGKNEQSGNIVAGVMSAAMAAYFGYQAYAACSNSLTSAACIFDTVAALGTAYGAVAAFTAGSSRPSTYNPLTNPTPGGDPGNNDVCANNPSDPTCFHGDPCAQNLSDPACMPPGGGVPPGAKKQLVDLKNNLDNLIKKQGLDPKDPNLLKKLTAKAGLAEGGGLAGAMANLSDAQKAEIAKAQKEALAKYGLSDVALEEAGGGHHGGGGGGSDGGIDMDALMKSLGLGGGGEKKDDGTVAGLNKTIGGEPIGVASDNIFQQMSRRYDAKKSSNIFIK